MQAFLLWEFSGVTSVSPVESGMLGHNSGTLRSAGSSLLTTWLLLVAAEVDTTGSLSLYGMLFEKDLLKPGSSCYPYSYGFHGPHYHLMDSRRTDLSQNASHSVTEHRGLGCPWVILCSLPGDIPCLKLGSSL